MADGECNYVLYDKPEAVVNIRIQNLQCASHVEHMDHRRNDMKNSETDERTHWIKQLICCLVSKIGGRSRSREKARTSVVRHRTLAS